MKKKNSRGELLINVPLRRRNPFAGYKIFRVAHGDGLAGYALAGLTHPTCGIAQCGEFFQA